MKVIQVFNNISRKGLSHFPDESYSIVEETQAPEAILLRSKKIHDIQIPPSLKAVGRAGAGVNNIPVDRFSEMGIPVFNTPGANANAVKELVVAGLMLACRNLCDAREYVKSLDGTPEEMGKMVEAGKKQFAGTELPGRTLGIIGLGAIGRSVATIAIKLGMRVIGFDPDLTVEGAWQLPHEVQRAGDITQVLRESDFLTVHVPFNASTEGMIDAKSLNIMHSDAVILNFARGGIIDDQAVTDALDAGRLGRYVTDFPNPILQGHGRVIALPHLGASTSEAEENCAMMVVGQVRDYLENGNIRNSVNFPEVVLGRGSPYRLAVVNRNVPNMLGQISTMMADLNIAEMINQSRGELAYTMVDTDSPIPDELLAEINGIEGVLSARLL